jgi:DNA-binding NtrC family response regulator
MAELEYSDLKLVVIDNDEMVVKSLTDVLEDFGFKVHAFTLPLKALEWIEKNGADIVVTDIRMPECDGFHVLSRVKEIDPQCAVILITAHGQVDTAVKALRQGAADFFEKPFDIIDLRAAIERTTRFRTLAQERQILGARVDGLSRELSYRKSEQNVMVGQSSAMKEVARNIVDVAASAATVLIIGESGTGKELVANAIQRASARRDKPMLTLNCASIPETLFESEMFGHIRGSFTGATRDKAGYVEAADGGTLFLDEIADLSLGLQGKILRLLEQRTYLSVGSAKERSSDIRLIAATNRPMEELVAEKQFREDLYYRLSVCTIRIPPLRERRDDIPLLAAHLALQCAAQTGKSVDGIDESALRVLNSHDYPGNVRELRNIIENAVIRCPHPGKLTAADLPQRTTKDGQPVPLKSADESWPIDTLNLEEVERRLYREALRRTDHNVSAAASLVGLSRSKLRRRMSALGL